MKKGKRLSAKDKRLLRETLRELNLRGRLQEEKRAKQHGKTSVYQHSIRVAYFSLWLAGRLPLRTDRRALVRGALLHDYFLYDWHEKGGGHRLHGFRHGRTAAKNASRDYGLSGLERGIIARHMFPLTVLPPKSKEGWVVCLADKWCAAEESLHPLFRRKKGNKKAPANARAKADDGNRTRL
nr:HD domain-containing protein [uncultured Anaerotignum sp.]